MSPKELLYIEDALGHDKQIRCTCNDSAQKLENPELASFVREIGQKHVQCFNTFYGLVGGKNAG
ncbi:MAG: hypothetical protein IJW02_04300 [Clostridia bacterium]|nr:hypothetical protein [Clostridia bacterium]